MAGKTLAAAAAAAGMSERAARKTVGRAESSRTAECSTSAPGTRPLPEGYRLERVSI